MRSVDLGDVVLAPAFVNAHAHLELSGLAGWVAPEKSFERWIRGVIAARGARTRAQMERDARAGATRLLAGGTTLVGDIDSTGAIVGATRGLPLSVVRFREALDAGDPARTPAALARVSGRSVRRARFHEGLSPHAPYTVSAGLFASLGSLARARRWPVAVHWAETRAEALWLEHGRGSFRGLLSHAPRVSGLAAIEAAGLLGQRTLLVHGNHATRAERERVRSRGATLVHCPGTHRFFGRERFDARAWLDLGVPLALGTDSLASNEDLDMGRELALFAAACPDVSPLEAYRSATLHGARALGFPGEHGDIAAGAWADFVGFDVRGTSDRRALEAVVHGSARIVATFARGVRIGPPGRVLQPGRRRED